MAETPDETTHTTPADAPEVTATARLRGRPLALMAQALGGASAARAKARRLGAMLRGYADGRELRARLERLRARGLIERVPTAVQLAVGGYDMLRFWISPAAADYYRARGISYAFHQVLRFLDEPASLADPVGLFSTRDGIIGHVMQVVHANPLYDLQLLEMFADGTAQLEAQLAAMLAGTHPRAASIGAIVEEGDYHARLLAYVRAYRRDRRAPPPLRSNVAASAEFRRLEAVFGSLTGAFRYFNAMPRAPLAALAHVYRTRTSAGITADPPPA